MIQRPENTQLTAFQRATAGEARGSCRPGWEAHRGLWVSLLLVAGVWALYGRMLKYQFISYDTWDFVIGNPVVNAGLSWEGLRWAFSTNHGGYWMPLTWLTHMLDCQLYGLNPAGHLATNLLIHTLNSLLLFCALRRLTGAFWRCAFVAAIFALHPTHVETVAWVAERKGVLSAFFWILTLLAYNSYARGAFSIRRWLVVILMMALGLLSKPSVVTLPFLLLLLDFWPLRRWPAGPAEEGTAAEGIGATVRKTAPAWLFIEKIPLFLLSIASAVVTYHDQKTMGVVTDLPLLVRLTNVPIHYLGYLRETFYPFSLSVYYPLSRTLQPVPEIGVAIFLLGVLTLIAILSWRSRPWLLAGWLWFIGLLVPMIGIVQVFVASIADRYTYLSQTGLAICVAWGGAEVLGRLRRPGREAGLLVGLLLTLLMLRSAHQLTFWRDDLSLWEHAVQVTPPSAQLYSALGYKYEVLGEYAHAEIYYRICVELEPWEAKYYAFLGRAKAERGDYAAAVQDYRRAIEMKGSDHRVHVLLGESYFAMKRVDEALAQYEKARGLVSIDPHLDCDLGLVYFAKGDWAGASVAFERALKYEPRSGVALFNLGRIAREAKKNNAEALRYFEAAAAASPENPDIARAIEELRGARRE